MRDQADDDQLMDATPHDDQGNAIRLLADKHRQLSNVHRNPSRLIAGGATRGVGCAIIEIDCSSEYLRGQTTP
jgi:hypothetical protein